MSLRVCLESLSGCLRTWTIYCETRAQKENKHIETYHRTGVLLQQQYEENKEAFPRTFWICSCSYKCYILQYDSYMIVKWFFCSVILWYQSTLDVSFRCEVKLTYDGNLFDIPGGRTDGREPATRTAERETFEESGYQVRDGRMAVLPRKWKVSEFPK